MTDMPAEMPAEAGIGVVAATRARLAATSPRQRDIALAAGVGLLGAVLHLGFSSNPDRLVEGPLGTLVIMLMAVPLAWRRTHAHLVSAASGTFIALYYLGGGDSPAGVLVFVFALYASAAFDTRREGLLSLTISTLFMTGSYVLSGGLEAVVTADYLLVLFVFVIAWALGEGTRTRLALAAELRARADQLETLRAVEQAELVAAERRRIARELHDVISHTVAVVVVQAGAAGRVLDADPEAARAALGAIEQRGRDAMVELRRMLGVLRAAEGDAPVDDVAPAPDLASVGTLVASLRDAGLPVELDADLDRELPAGVALTVHRVVQEGLTNVLRHAEDVHAVDVVIEHRDGHVQVVVRDDGRPAGFTEGAGTGLLGLRERVALHGGRVSGQPRTGRGFELRAEVPLGGSA